MYIYLFDDDDTGDYNSITKENTIDNKPFDVQICLPLAAICFDRSQESCCCSPPIKKIIMLTTNKEDSSGCCTL